MTSSTRTLLGAVLAIGLAFPGVASADVIHLANGSAIEVEAWRDVGDAIEFARSGGIIRISKADIAKIEGNTTRSDLRMRSAPASVGASTGGGDLAAVAKDMASLLAQGAAMFTQTVLSSAEKARGFRKLGDSWLALTVPEPLRDAHARGQEAFQIAAEAYTADDEGTAPDAKERIEAAKTAVEEAQEQVKKASGEKTGGEQG